MRLDTKTELSRWEGLLWAENTYEINGSFVGPRSKLDLLEGTKIVVRSYKETER